MKQLQLKMKIFKTQLDNLCIIKEQKATILVKNIQLVQKEQQEQKFQITSLEQISKDLICINKIIICKGQGFEMVYNFQEPQLLIKHLDINKFVSISDQEILTFNAQWKVVQKVQIETIDKALYMNDFFVFVTHSQLHFYQLNFDDPIRIFAFDFEINDIVQLNDFGLIGITFLDINSNYFEIHQISLENDDTDLENKVSLDIFQNVNEVQQSEITINFTKHRMSYILLDNKTILIVIALDQKLAQQSYLNSSYTYQFEFEILNITVFNRESSIQLTLTKLDGLLICGKEEFYLLTSPKQLVVKDQNYLSQIDFKLEQVYQRPKGKVEFVNPNLLSVDNNLLISSQKNLSSWQFIEKEQTYSFELHNTPLSILQSGSKFIMKHDKFWGVYDERFQLEYKSEKQIFNCPHFKGMLTVSTLKKYIDPNPNNDIYLAPQKLITSNLELIDFGKLSWPQLENEEQLESYVVKSSTICAGFQIDNHIVKYVENIKENLFVAQTEDKLLIFKISTVPQYNLVILNEYGIINEELLQFRNQLTLEDLQRLEFLRTNNPLKTLEYTKFYFNDGHISYGILATKETLRIVCLNLEDNRLSIGKEYVMIFFKKNKIKKKKFTGSLREISDSYKEIAYAIINEEDIYEINAIEGTFKLIYVCDQSVNKVLSITQEKRSSLKAKSSQQTLYIIKKNGQCLVTEPDDTKQIHKQFLI